MTFNWLNELPRTVSDPTRYLLKGNFVPAFEMLGNDLNKIWTGANAEGKIDQARTTVRVYELFKNHAVTRVTPS